MTAEEFDAARRLYALIGTTNAALDAYNARPGRLRRALRRFLRRPDPFARNLAAARDEARRLLAELERNPCED